MAKGLLGEMFFVTLHGMDVQYVFCAKRGRRIEGVKV